MMSMQYRLVVALALIALTSAAQAQLAVKRFPCKDLFSSDTVGYNPIYHNNTGFTQYIHIQVTRNGCVPRNLFLFFGVGAPPHMSSSWRGSLSGKRPSGIGFDVPADQSAYLYVSPSPDTRIRGSVDFAYMID